MIDGETNESGRNKRRHERLSVLHSGTLVQGDQIFDCVIKDISATGAQLMTKAPVAAQREFVLDIDHAGLFPSRLVWRSENRVGLQFLQDPDSVARRISAAWGLPS
jgi:hypothetical protein